MPSNAKPTLPSSSEVAEKVCDRLTRTLVMLMLAAIVGSIIHIGHRKYEDFRRATMAAFNAAFLVNAVKKFKAEDRLDAAATTRFLLDLTYQGIALEEVSAMTRDMDSVLRGGAAIPVTMSLHYSLDRCRIALIKAAEVSGKGGDAIRRVFLAYRSEFCGSLPYHPTPSGIVFDEQGVIKKVLLDDAAVQALNPVTSLGNLTCDIFDSCRPLATIEQILHGVAPHSINKLEVNPLFARDSAFYRSSKLRLDNLVPSELHIVDPVDITFRLLAALGTLPENAISSTSGDGTVDLQRASEAAIRQFREMRPSGWGSAGSHEGVNVPYDAFPFIYLLISLYLVSAGLVYAKALYARRSLIESAASILTDRTLISSRVAQCGLILAPILAVTVAVVVFQDYFRRPLAPVLFINPFELDFRWLVGERYFSAWPLGGEAVPQTIIIACGALLVLACVAAGRLTWTTRCIAWTPNTLRRRRSRVGRDDVWPDS